MSVETSDLQYMYCAVCLEMQDLKQPEMAITIVNGSAVCEDHRRRVSNIQLGAVIAGARKNASDGDRPGYRNGRRDFNRTGQK